MNRIDHTTERVRILAVDDAGASLTVLRRLLSAAGHEVRTATGVAEAMAVLEFQPVDLVVADIKKTPFDGLDLRRYVRDNFSRSEILMIARDFPAEDAEDYLRKPFSGDDLLRAVARMTERLMRRRMAAAASRPFSGLVGECDGLKTAFAQMEKAAAARANVLISGESGAGRECAARAVHYSSDRAAAPFVHVNCGGVPEAYAESALFGRVNSAFPGARQFLPGCFQMADGGTLYLEGVEDASMSMQEKLLQALQEKEIHAVGSGRLQKTDVRIIASARQSLAPLIQSGRFGKDLFDRLKVIHIVLPPLRERGEDILRLLAHFTRKFALASGRPAPGFTESAVRSVMGYAWPGNVRELEDLARRLVSGAAAGVIDAADLPAFMRLCSCGGDAAARSLADVEAEHISRVLAAAGGNKTRAAEILGVDRKTLRMKLQKAGAPADAPGVLKSLHPAKKPDTSRSDAFSPALFGQSS